MGYVVGDKRVQKVMGFVEWWRHVSYASDRSRIKRLLLREGVDRRGWLVLNTENAELSVQL